MGFCVRRADLGEAAQVAAVLTDTWKAAYRGIIDDAFLDALAVDETRLLRTREQIESGGVFVALNAGRIVGAALFGEATKEKCAGCGELYALYVLPAYHGAGLGRGLVDAICAELAARGFRQAVIGCLADNPSRGFYERLGCELREETVCHIGGRDYPERIYMLALADNSRL